MLSLLSLLTLLAQVRRTSPSDEVDAGWIVFAFVSLIVLIVVILFVKTNIHICDPNEVLIFSGRRTKSRDGISMGYRIIKGGRGWRWPVGR